jgi:hypothetical protein
MPKGQQVKDMAIVGIRKGEQGRMLLKKGLSRTSGWDFLELVRNLVEPAEWAAVYLDRVPEGTFPWPGETHPSPDADQKRKGK